MKGCTRKKCPYPHELCETEEEFKTLLDRVTLNSSSSSEADTARKQRPGQPKNAEANSPGKVFRNKYCRFGSGCKFKGTDKCKLDHTTFPTLAKWKEGLKAATGKDVTSSDDDA